MAHEFIKGLGLKSQHEYFAFWDRVKPGIIPKYVNNAYRRSGWKNWADFLGIVSPRSEGWRSYEKAENFVHSLRLKNHGGWVAYCRGEFKQLPPKPADIPFNPYSVCVGKGWETWGKWLGNKNVRRHVPVYQSFSGAREFARSLKLASVREWRKYVNGQYPHLTTKPSDIPATPHIQYSRTGWVSWADFLGTEGKRVRKDSPR